MDSRTSSSVDSERAMPEPSSSLTLTAPRVRPRPATDVAGWQRAARHALIALAAAYLSIVLFAPLAAMGVELVQMGIGKALASLLEPEALAALRMSLLL